MTVIRVTYEGGYFERDLRGLFCCQVKHALSCLNKDDLVLYTWLGEYTLTTATVTLSVYY